MNVHITHTFDLGQGDGQGILVVFVNSDGKVKNSGKTLPKVTRTLQTEKLSSLLGTWTCSCWQGWIWQTQTPGFMPWYSKFPGT